MLLVQVAYGALEHLLADMELVVYILRSRLVGERAVAVVVEKVFMETLREVESLLASLFLQCNIQFAIRSYSRDEAFKAVTGMQFAEYLVVIDKSLVFVVDNDLESEVGLLPHKEFYLCILLIFGEIRCQEFLHLCRGHDAV